MIEWCFTPLSTVFQSYHGDSSHYSCLSWVSPVLGWALKCLAQGHSQEKTQRIQCGSNPGPLDYKSNILPLGQAGPYIINESTKFRYNRKNCRRSLRYKITYFCTQMNGKTDRWRHRRTDRVIPIFTRKYSFFFFRNMTDKYYERITVERINSSTCMC